MKTLKLYWLRFQSKTPKALKKLQWFLGAVAAAAIGALEIIDRFAYAPDWRQALVIVASVSTGGILFLKFSTSDPKIQDLTKNDV